jgi:hypothetical protein
VLAYSRIKTDRILPCGTSRLLFPTQARLAMLEKKKKAFPIEKIISM